ncbi:MAG: sigma-54-dependent Fis family transcriptional regulator [bacterium]|nr:sigma-54-dependent Fis family transcriptional regulator [bacterium]
MDNRVLIVDDEHSIVTTLRDDLTHAGYAVDTAQTIQHAENLLTSNDYFCVITDIRLPDGNGLAFMERAKASSPCINTVVITGYGSIESAVSAMKHGAFDFVLKPFYNEEIINILDKLSEIDSLKQENTLLRRQIHTHSSLKKIIGKSKKMQDVLSLISTVSLSDASILITGESGTGKEIAAGAIHELSPRSSRAFIKMNCAVFTPSLLEDELFGHEKGAFTGAVNRKAGRFELANGGSIFLDDIDDMDLNTQVKLLRVLQEREFERVGGTNTIKVDVRIIASSKTDLRTLVEKGAFREDLFYRLNVVSVKLPPLRERKEDIPLLIDHFVQMYAKNKRVVFDNNALDTLIEYEWPGNIRELENTIEGVLAVAGVADVLSPALLPDAICHAHGGKPVAEPHETEELSEYVRECERVHICRILNNVNGSKTEAARILGISRKSLWQKIKKLNL